MIQCEKEEECAERARLLIERAGEMLSRRRLSVPNRIRAVSMLHEARLILLSKDPSAAEALKREIRRAESDLLADYQQEVMRLRSAVKNKNSDEISASAARLKEALKDCDDGVKKQMERLIAVNQGLSR